MKKAIIISGNLVQDQEFIYPYYRLLEEEFDINVCLNEKKFVKGILGSDIPPNKNQKLVNIEDIEPENYNFLVLPGGVKSMEKVRQNKKIPLEDKNIVFTFSHSAKIIYNVEKFKEWFENNKWVAHIDFNAEIRRVMENVNRDREVQGMKKI